MKQNNSGFTIIELMIVIIVVSILAAIAIPSYRDYVIKSRRSDAKAGITEVQLAEEKWRANNISYTSTLADLGLITSSPDNHYVLSLSGVTATTYTITAVPTGDQAVDSDCDPMTIDESGNKTPATGCW